MTKRGPEDSAPLSSSPSSSLTVSDPHTSSIIEHNNNGITSNKKVKLEPTTDQTSSTTHETTTYNPIPTTMNGTTSDELHSMNNNNGTPSRVVHIRNIPQDAHESDLTNLAMPFGKVSNLLFLRGKNQAMIEFADLASAQCMVSYWQQHPQPTVRGRSVYCQFSNHQQIKAESTGGTLSANGYNNNGHGEESLTETPVLRVVVEQLMYPVTVDHFYQLFSRYGKVTKVVTFQKNGSYQALVQFETSGQAATAKQGLDGTSMFAPQNGSNLLRVGFSKLTNLNVRFNNDKSRDYTNPSLPSGGPGSGGYGAGGAGDAGLGHPLAMDPVALAAFAATHSATAALNAATLGYPTHAATGQGSGTHGHHGHHQSLGAYGAGSAGGGRLGGRADNSLMSAHGMGGMGFGSVLLASNLPEQIATPDALFTLFGVFGDVIRVKVLFNKKDNALIQMAEAQQANVAASNLDRLKIFGKTLKVTPSRHQLVQMPKEGQPDAGLTKDYTNSPLHRFKKPGSKNYSNIFSPSTTLHLSNIPATVSEEDLKQIFRDLVGRPDSVVSFRFFPKDRKMALISLASLDDAILALVHGHNYQLAESAHLRVSFSKSNI